MTSLPILLRRICDWRSPHEYVEVCHPIRVHRDKFLHREEEFQRHLLFAAAKCGEAGWVMILLDADDDCPAMLSANILARARAVLPHRPVSVILANREYEAWFIGAAASLNGERSFEVTEADLAIDAETPRNAKGWLRDRMGSRVYGETTDQPAFSARMDLQQAFNRCRSFRKLCAEWDRQLAQPRS